MNEWRPDDFFPDAPAPAAPAETPARSPLALPTTPIAAGIVGTLLGLGLIILTIFVLDLIIIKFAYPDIMVEDLESAPLDPRMLQMMKWSSAFVTVAAVLLFKIMFKIPWPSFGIRRTPLGPTLLFGLAAILLAYAPNILVMISFIFNEESQFASEELQQKVEFMELMTTQSTLQIMVLMVAVAIHEELIFRGLLIPCLKRIGLPFGVAIVISSAIFGVLHAPAQGWTGAMATFGIGLVFGMIFVVSRSLWVVIAAHFVFNVSNSMLVSAFDLEEVRKHIESIAPVEVIHMM